MLRRITLSSTGFVVVGCLALGLSPASAVSAAAVPRTDPTITLEPGDSGKRVSILQKRLEWMGYSIDRGEQKRHYFGQTTTVAVKKFQEKFFLRSTAVIKTRDWRILDNKSRRLGWLPPSCRVGRVICVDMNAKLLRYVLDGKIKLALDARFGFEGEETREGSFTVYWKNRDQWSSAFDAPMPFSLFFSRGQAIHFSPYFKKDGYYGASHGCVNIRDREAARWMFDNSPVGTPVIIYDGKD